MKKLTAIALFGLAGASFALQGGPTQPDYAQFEPSGMQDMVSMQSGDFSYQIPLSDIPGPWGNYPLSLSYHAGISPQQEASWVGLGWSLNPGAISRDVRGVPDDQFHGGTLGFIYRYSSMQTWTVDLGYSNGVFSVGQTFSSDGSVGFSASVGPKIAGVVSVGFTVGTDAVGLSASVGNQTASLNASLMFSTTNGKANASVGAKLQAGGASMGAQVSTGGGASANVGFGNSKAGVGLTVSSNGVSASAHVGQVAMSKSKNGTSVSVGGGSLSVSNSSSKGKNKTSTAGFAIVVPTQIGVFSFGFSQNTYEYWMRSATSEYLYGYIYQAGPAVDVKKENMITGMPEAFQDTYHSGGKMDWTVTAKGRTLEHLGGNVMYPAYDMYSVSSEGVSGSFRPFAREAHQLHMRISEKFASEDNFESYSMILKDSLFDCNHDKIIDENDFCYDTWVHKSEFALNGEYPVENNEYLDYKKCLDDQTCSLYGKYKTNFRNNGNRLVYNSDENEFEEHGGMRFLFVGENGGYFESEKLDEKNKLKGSKGRPANEVFKELLYKKEQSNYEYALYGSKKIEPIFEENDPSGRLQGFVITTADGSKYFFTQPVKSYLKTDYTINQQKGAPVFIDKAANKYDNFFDNLLKGLYAIGKWSLEHLNPFAVVSDAYNFIFKPGKLEEKCKANENGESNDYFYSYTVNMNPHATQWLLTEIQGADFVKLGENIEDNVGYNVKFKYSDKPSVYHWRTPYARPDLGIGELPNFRQARNGLTPEGCDSKMYQASFGVKENVYLESIETSTHKVNFVLNTKERVDGKGWQTTADNRMPIWVQASMKYEWSYTPVSTKRVYRGAGQYSYSTYEQTSKINIVPKTIYFNSELPSTLLAKLQKTGSINVYGIEQLKIDGLGELKINEATRGSHKGEEQKGIVAIKIADDAVVEKCTSKEDLKYGLYKVNIATPTGSPYTADVSVENQWEKHLQNILENNVKNNSIVIGDNGDVQKTLMIDWGEIVFASSTEEDPYENQMRYLEKIQYVNKADESHPYKEYTFNYDYSLQPKTLNSYCLGNTAKNNGYPKTMKQVTESDESVGTGICEEGGKNGLYGKLTLRSIKETGCQNGKCASLPPFKFSYNSPSATPTRISIGGEWKDYLAIDYSIEVTKNVDGQEVTEYESVADKNYEDIDDLDATILASANTTDEFGFWSNTASLENHKVDPYLATFGASAWSLNKVVDPAGGNLEVEYERDTYKDGEYYGDEHLVVDVMSFNQCDQYKDEFSIPSNDESRLCIQIGKLYWREQCLGPRVAHWDKTRPLADNTDGYAYLDSLGITKDKHIPNDAKDRPTVFFNIKSGIKTTVSCGMFGVGKCDRKRTVALMGESQVRNMIEASDHKSRVLVFEKAYGDAYHGLQRAADKINSDKNWKINPRSYGSYGNMWVRQSRPIMPGGDLRVTRLTRHDMNLKSQTVYNYGVGELAQLADSAYTTVLGSRFNHDKISYALPDVDLKPISRIVGFNDDDAMFLPGARITYPKVSVINTVNDAKSQLNGRTEFNYVTPETGVPEEYIDEKTKASLPPFIKFNIRMVKIHGEKAYDETKEKPVYANYGRIFKISLLDDAGNVIADNTKKNHLAQVTKVMYEDDLNQVYFYSDDVKNAKTLRIDEVKQNLNDTMSVYLKLFSSHESEKLGNFNEFMIALRCGFAGRDNNKRDEYAPHAHKVWFRKQKEGFYPILYKMVKYDGKIIERPALKLKNFDYPILPKLYVSCDLEGDDTYHDFTAFLGQNYKTSFYRGTENNEILVKKDSSIYSTIAPSVLSTGLSTSGNVAEKIGRQVERWTSERQLQCKDNSDGEEHYCYTQNIALGQIYGSSTKTDFTYIRYPAFQIGTVNFVGHDNQDKVVAENSSSSCSSVQSSSSSAEMKFGVTELRNYRFDPITGSPTATMAVSKLGNKEIRKITQTTPAYAITESGLSDEMLRRNMFTQNYLEEVYTDTIDVFCDESELKADPACELHKTTHEDKYGTSSCDKKNYDKLRSYSISPYTMLPASLYDGQNESRTPIVAMGTFKNKVAPATTRCAARDYLEYSYGNKTNRPSLDQYNGTYIEKVNKGMKVLTTEDILERTQSTVFSDDAMNQLSLFFPAKIDEVGVVVPYMNKVFASEGCSVTGTVSVDKNLIVANSNVTILCNVTHSSNFAVEYRKWENSKGWETKRDVKSSGEAKVALKSGEKLNYFRVYPENAEAKTFIYDINGNMVQTIAEDNTSTYYEYDPFGKLVQSRNDDGVSFKSHHREYMNNEEN